MKCKFNSALGCADDECLKTALDQGRVIISWICPFFPIDRINMDLGAEK